MIPYPLQFTPILKSKVWGGRTLERYNKQLPQHQPIGESWEIADLPTTSTDGGGGDSAVSTIRNGESQGLTIQQAITALGQTLMGAAKLHTNPDTNTHHFPLLIKLLDAATNLSVQVHPSPEYASKHPDAHLKTESWYIVHAEPNAVIYKGVKPNVTKDQFRKAIADNTVEHHMNAVPVKPGDVHHLPSGTCHALGSGILVAEVQTPSDTTYRVYDWGRTNRTLHIDQALDCITDFHHQPSLDPIRPDTTKARSPLGATDFYELFDLRANAGDTHSLLDTKQDLPVILMCLQGQGQLAPATDQNRPTSYTQGDTTLIPARLDALTINPTQDSIFLEVRFPS